MTVFRRKRTKKVKGRKVSTVDRLYSYDFEIAGVRYRGSTGLDGLEDAQAWELREKKRIRRRNRGIESDDPADMMPIQEWAEEYREIKIERGCVIGPIDAQLAVVLRFFGAKPEPGTGVMVDDKAPYHDLTLRDVVDDPYWVHRFDQWIRARDVGWQTRNHYRSRMSDLYAVASELIYRRRTGVTMNPFAGMTRERKRKVEKIIITPEEVARWIEQASYHARLAISIGMLAPKLRRASILSLDFLKHIRYASEAFPRPRAIVVQEHKAADDHGRPQVYPITRQLARILIGAWRRNQKQWPGSTRVVLYRGKPVKDIEESVKAAALAAGLTYGRYGGVTFHRLRDIASSFFATTNTNAFKQLDLMGWSDLRTPLHYTHLDVETIRIEAERLSAAMPIAKAVMLPHQRAKKHRPMVGTLASLRPGSRKFLEAKRDTEKEATRSRKRGNA